MSGCHLPNKCIPTFGIMYLKSCQHTVSMKHDLCTLLCGTNDTTSSLSKLQGQRDILELIACETDKLYDEHIQVTNKAFATLYPKCNRYMDHSRYYDKTVKFPPPQNININMMPIKLWDLENTLPPELQGYKQIIASCYYSTFKVDTDGSYYVTSNDAIGYLTIHESYVEPGKTQRRPGLHIERPGVMASQDTRLVMRPSNERLQAIQLYNPNRQTPTAEELSYMNLAWGLGAWIDGIPVDGIYMASTVDDSCAIYPALIERPWEITNEHGECECLRHRLPAPTLTKANQLYWITDRTPHEAILSPTGGYRQFFRLVVGRVSTWYAKHNTPNPLCDPDAPISYDDKFTQRKE